MDLMTANEIEILIERMPYSEIAALREDLEREGNPNFMLRSLYYDYKNQAWIEPNRGTEYFKQRINK